MDDNIEESSRDLDMMKELNKAEEVLRNVDDGSLGRALEKREADIKAMEVKGDLLRELLGSLTAGSRRVETRIEEAET